MGIAVGPKIVTDGLVLCLDAGDLNSYPGEPTTNLVTAPLVETGYVGDYYDDYNSGWGSTSRIKVENIMGPFGKMVNVISEELLSTTDSPHIQGVPNNMSGSYTNNITLTSGVEYIISLYVKSSTTDSTSNMIYLIGASGNQGDVARTATTEWLRQWRTFTPTVTGTHSIRHYFYSVTVGFKVYYTAYQIEVKDHPTQFTTGTRSAIDGWKDLINNNGFDLDTVSFDSDAQIIFNGSSKIDCGVVDYGEYVGLSVSCWFNGYVGTSYKDTLMVLMGHLIIVGFYLIVGGKIKK